MYSIQEVAKIFSISRITVYRLIQDGKVKAIKMGRSYKIAEEEVERLKREGTK